MGCLELVEKEMENYVKDRGEEDYKSGSTQSIHSSAERQFTQAGILLLEQSEKVLS
jgi:hypothetical protein